MSNVKCPVCGADNLSKRSIRKTIEDSFVAGVEIDIVEYSCEVCGAEGDLFNENDALILSTLNSLKAKVAINILEDFSQRGFNFASLERILELPQRTLSKWKNESTAPSAAGVTLLKYIRTFPWLIDVAERNFDFEIAQKIHLTTAFQQIINGMQFNKNNLTHAGLIATTSESFFYMHFEKQEQNALNEIAMLPYNSMSTVKWSVVNES